MIEPEHIQEIPEIEPVQDRVLLDRRRRLPVSVIALPVPAVRAESRMSKVLKGLAQSGVVPVVDRKKRLLGLIGERALLNGDFEGQGRYRFEEADGSSPVTLRPDDTIGLAIERFAQTDQHLIPIVTPEGHYTGECASRSQLFRLVNGMLRPPRAGGLATPLGVYLTSGYHIAGAGVKGLIATGLMFGAIIHLMDRLWLVAYSALAALYPAMLRLDLGDYLVLETGFTLSLLMAMLRLTPISGLHAAEHMTISAIENDLELTEPEVRTQPREHIRCGTNLMVVLGGTQLLVTTLIMSADRISPVGMLLYAAFWVFIITKFWRPAGLWVQRHFTTRPPSSSELASGIRAGRELLDKFNEEPHGMPSFWQRIRGSGLLVMLASCLGSAWLIGFVLEKLGI